MQSRELRSGKEKLQDEGAQVLDLCQKSGSSLSHFSSTHLEENPDVFTSDTSQWHTTNHHKFLVLGGLAASLPEHS